MAMASRVEAEAAAENGGRAPMAEINITPLIDVMLVLLIIFMISVPLVTYRMQIDVPQTGPKPLVKVDDVVVRIDDDNTILWADQPMNMRQIDYQLRQASRQDPQPRLVISAGDQSRYQVLAEVMAKAKNADLRSVGFERSPH